MMKVQKKVKGCRPIQGIFIHPSIASTNLCGIRRPCFEISLRRRRVLFLVLLKQTGTIHILLRFHSTNAWSRVLHNALAHRIPNNKKIDFIFEHLKSFSWHNRDVPGIEATGEILGHYRLAYFVLRHGLELGIRGYFGIGCCLEQNRRAPTRGMPGRQLEFWRQEGECSDCTVITENHARGHHTPLTECNMVYRTFKLSG